MTSSIQLREQRTKLYRKQRGKCHYCEVACVLISPAPDPPPLNLATLEHLDSRYSPFRGLYSGQKRRVMACWKCNQERAHQEREAEWAK